MKIKTTNNIIGVICKDSESEVVYNALVDYGVDSYTIYSEAKNGKTVYCFRTAALPCLTRNRRDAYTWVLNTDPNQPKKVGNAHPSTIDRFLEDFPKFYAENKKNVTFNVAAVCDYFNLQTASIGGKRLFA